MIGFVSVDVMGIPSNNDFVIGIASDDVAGVAMIEIAGEQYD